MTTTSVPDRDLADHGKPMYQEEIVRSPIVRFLLAGLRILMGWTFLWPFIDKLFGLGYATPTGARAGWLQDGSPTTGFLTKNPSVTEGPFADIFKHFAGGFWDWLFMAGLLGIGVAVLLGAGMKIAAWSGTLLLGLMYLAEFPIGRGVSGADMAKGAPTFVNPLTDSHWIEALALLVLAYTLSGDTLGIGRWWAKRVGNGPLR